MQKLFYTFTFLFVLTNASIHLAAQTTEDFIGEWEITEVVLDVGEVPPDKAPLIDYIQYNLESSSFELQEENYCRWDIDIPDLDLEEVYWAYYPQTKKIYIREWNEGKAGKTLLSFFVEEERDGRTVFIYARGFIAAKFYVEKIW